MIVIAGEPTGGENLVVGLHEKGAAPGIDVETGADVEVRVKGAVGVQPSKSVAIGSVVVGEIAGDENLAVGLNGGGEYEGVGVPIDGDAKDTVGSRARIKGGVKTAVRIQAGDQVARDALDVIEKAANDDFAVWLEGHGSDPIGGMGVKVSIDAAVTVETDDVAVGSIVESGEIPAGENCSVRAGEDCFNNAIGACAWIEAGVEQTARHVGQRGRRQAGPNHHSHC